MNTKKLFQKNIVLSREYLVLLKISMEIIYQYIIDY